LTLVKASFGNLPLYFIENQGIFPKEVAYYVKGVEKTLFFGADGITFRIRGKDRAWAVKLEFVGANPQARLDGRDCQQAVFSYFRGPEKNWKTGLRTYQKLVYTDLWPGIDLVYQGTVNRMKYEFLVHPGADPGRIRLRYTGATRVFVTSAGALRIETPAGGFEDAKPVAFQEVGGKRVEVKMDYALVRDQAHDCMELGFDIGSYDKSKPLILDPVLFVYCGYIGGIANDIGTSIAVDAAGCAYITGCTDSNETTFPVGVGPDLTYSGNTDAFVAKVNPQGTALVYPNGNYSPLSV